MFNTTDGAKSTDLLKKFSANIIRFARESDLVQRASRKFKPPVFLLALFKCAQAGNASYNNLVTQMSLIDEECSLSYQALHERLTRDEVSLEVFISKCLSCFVCDGVGRMTASIFEGETQLFDRCLIEDSTFLKLSKECADLFPAHGNKIGATAGVKLDLTFDLFTGETLDLSLHGGTAQDKTIGPNLIAAVRPNDLVLRDMGYFSIGEFDKIEENGAFWLSRLPSNVIAMTLRTGISLEAHLKSISGSIMDCQVQLTETGKQARLVAIRKCKNEGDKAVREIREVAKRKGCKPCCKAMVRARWHILVTNIPKDKVGTRKLGRIYALRWTIEMTFKGWKQCDNLRGALKHRSNYQHLIGIVLIGALKLALARHCYGQLQASGHPEIYRLSFAKLCIWFTKEISRCRRIGELQTTPRDLRHIFSEKRKRKNQIQSMLDVLA